MGSLTSKLRGRKAEKGEEAGASSDLEYASSCFFPTSWLAVPLTNKIDYNHNTKIFEFTLPEGRSLDLPTVACILMKAPGQGKDGEDAVRPYTPIREEPGKFELLIKTYPDGCVSSWIAELPIGTAVSFKHIEFNCKLQYPFGKQSISMICNGTAITPMFQAVRKLLETPGDTTRVTMLYGNTSEADILMKKELDAYAEQFKERFSIVYFVDKASDGFEGEVGYIDKARCEKYLDPPSDTTMVFVCGLPIIYDLFCGPRNEKGVKEGTVLHKLGYTDSMVSKF